MGAGTVGRQFARSPSAADRAERHCRCTDIIGFLVLNGLFTAHITGNLVILAAHIVGGGEAQIAPMLSVPVFIVMVGMTRC